MPTDLHPLSILVVEDDPSFALELEMLIDQIGYALAGVAPSAKAALEIIHAGEVDFILMDINLSGRMSGVDVGRQITHLDIPILYLTGFDTEAHYQAARASNFMGYLVKPVGKHTLRTTIGLAVGKIMQSRVLHPAAAPELSLGGDYLFVRRNRRLHEKVLRSDILLVEGADDYVKLWTNASQPYLLRQRMTDLTQLLSAPRFFRVHRSFIVNVSAIQAIDFAGGLVRVLDRDIPISRSKRADFERLVERLE